MHPEDVRGLPILWLGEEYDSDGDSMADMDLTVGQYNVSAELRDPATGELIRPETRSYLIGYGTCEIPEGVRGCPIPISITIYDPCTAPPLAEEVVRDTIHVRGVDALVYGEGSLRVEADGVTMNVHATGATRDEAVERARRVVEMLRGANPEAAQYAPGSTFAPGSRALRCE